MTDLAAAARGAGCRSGNPGREGRSALPAHRRRGGVAGRRATDVSAPLFADARGARSSLPDLGAPIADTHAHLDMLDDPARRARARGASRASSFIATVADLTEDASATFDELAGWLARRAAMLADWRDPSRGAREVRIIVGVHPHNAKGLRPEVDGELRRLRRRPRIVAHRRDRTRLPLRPLAARRPARVSAPARARARARPARRRAPARGARGGLAILREAGVPAAGCIIHCFTEGAERRAVPGARLLSLASPAR